jgi:AcrR family transcriptional regulator
MPVKGRSRRRDTAENRRSAILKAAREVFARRGFAETSVDDIAAAAGIAKGTAYLYFSSKEQIYLEALLERAREVEASSRARMLDADTWQDKIRAYMATRLEFLSAHSDFFRIYATEFRNMCMHGKALGAEIQELAREGERQVGQVLAIARAKGEIRPVDTDLAAGMIADMLRGLVDRRLLAFRRSPSAEDLEFTLDCVFRALERRAPDCSSAEDRQPT